VKDEHFRTIESYPRYRVSRDGEVQSCYFRGEKRTDTNYFLLDASVVESWLNERRRSNASARTRNVDRTALVSFGNWCASKNVRRLIANPFDDLPPADE
jgi:hypothetical protein